MMILLEHKHPLELVDLQPEDPNDENESDSDDDNNDDSDNVVIPENVFHYPCKRCGLQITGYHRYYYKCTIEYCCYSVHKFCAELPKSLNHSTHSHPLTLSTITYDYRYYRGEYKCDNCQTNIEGIHYKCSLCKFMSDVTCVLEVEKTSIKHPSHPHLLACLISESIYCPCIACGKKHKGIFYQCTTCSNFAVHDDCVFLPKKLLIQETTNNVFHHTHPLTISYSFPMDENDAKSDPLCRVCNVKFIYESRWIYKCEKCIYYTHVDCATSTSNMFIGNTIKNFHDADYRDLLHLPFLNDSGGMLKHLFSKEAGPEIYKVKLSHINHQHPLILVNTESINTVVATSSMCHNPMKRIELLCDACLRPIKSMPFYKCDNEDESCNFSLHEWCTRLPPIIENHPGHPQDTLFLMTNVPNAFFGIFCCAFCYLPCSGFAYGCVKCGYYVDVSCGFIPKNITHKSHPNHVFRLENFIYRWKKNIIHHHCHMCGSHIVWDPWTANNTHNRIVYKCETCELYIHSQCALLLPEIIRHKYDKHPMHLSYVPAQNHKSEYFCEICENKLNPNTSFYHCDDCAQSVHSACAPLINRSETDTCDHYKNSIYMFLNVKFGRIHKIGSHPHPLSFSQGIESDGNCNMCGKELHYEMIFKCLKCKFAVDFKCCDSLNKT